MKFTASTRHKANGFVCCAGGWYRSGCPGTWWSPAYLGSSDRLCMCWWALRQCSPPALLTPRTHRRLCHWSLRTVLLEKGTFAAVSTVSQQFSSNGFLHLLHSAEEEAFSWTALFPGHYLLFILGTGKQTHQTGFLWVRARLRWRPASQAEAALSPWCPRWRSWWCSWTKAGRRSAQLQQEKTQKLHIHRFATSKHTHDYLLLCTKAFEASLRFVNSPDMYGREVMRAFTLKFPVCRTLNCEFEWKHFRPRQENPKILFYRPFTILFFTVGISGSIAIQIWYTLIVIW